MYALQIMKNRRVGAIIFISKGKRSKGRAREEQGGRKGLMGTIPYRVNIAELSGADAYHTITISGVNEVVMAQVRLPI